MTWLQQLVAAVFPRPSGLLVDEADPIRVEARPSPEAFFRALAVLVTPDAVLYWEGPAERHLAEWLARQTLEPRPAVTIGVAPARDFYHIPLDEDVLAELALRVARPGAMSSKVRLHVRKGERIVLEWRPAFGRSPLLLSRHVPEEQVRQFISLLSAT